MTLYSFNGRYPTELPESVKLLDNTTRTNLSALNLSELVSIGFTGPITQPSYNPNTQKLEWNSATETFSVVGLSTSEIEYISERPIQVGLATRFSSENIGAFWESFKTSYLYPYSVGVGLTSEKSLRAFLNFCEYVGESRCQTSIGVTSRLQDGIEGMQATIISVGSTHETNFSNMLDEYSLTGEGGVGLKTEGYFSNRIFRFTPNKHYQGVVITPGPNTINDGWTWNSETQTATPPFPAPAGNYVWDAELYASDNTQGWVEIT